MLVTVNCLLTASPSPQSHLTSLLQSININSTLDQSNLTLSSGHFSVSLHPSLLCSLSPLLFSLFLSSSSLTTILLPSVSPCSLPLARELLYTGQCKGSLMQLGDVVLLLDLLGVQILNEVVPCCEADGQIREGPFFLGCESTNNNRDEDVEDALPAVQDNSKILGLPFDETYTQEQFVSIVASAADDDFDALNLQDIRMESLPSCEDSEIILYPPIYVQEVEKENKSGEGQTDFVSNARNSKEVRSYPCDKCGYIATQNCNLKRHKEAVHGKIKIIEQYKGNVYPCNECGYIAKLKGNLKRHKKAMHGRIKAIEQYQGVEVGLNEDNPSSEAVYALNVKSFPCNQCEYNTSQKCNLKRHNQAMNNSLNNLKQDHSKEGKVNEDSKDPNIKIDKGNEAFDMLNLNKIEEESLHSLGNSDILLSDDDAGLKEDPVNQEEDCRSTNESKCKEMNYPCNLCNYITTLKVRLKRHYKAKHGVQNSMKGQSNEVEECEDIKEEFRIGFDNLKQQLFPCNQCEYVATQNGHLKRHVLAKHSLDRFKCNFCEKLFTLKESLHRHVKSLHENQTYPCPECNFVGKRPENLKHHVKCKHSEEKVNCDECGYQASTERLIKKHKLKIHKGIKYPCDMCDYQAADKSSLSYHIKSTHDKIRVQCDICNRKFTKKTSLKRHMILKHSITM